MSEKQATSPQGAYTKLEAAHYDEIMHQERAIRSIEFELEFAKENYAEHKARLKAAQSELRNLIHEGPDAQRRLPGLDHDPIVRETGPAWKRVPLDRIIGSGDLLKMLANAGITTVGEMADYSNSGKKLVSIKGIGEVGEAKIIEAMQTYWADPDAYEEEEEPQPRDAKSEGSGDE